MFPVILFILRIIVFIIAVSVFAALIAFMLERKQKWNKKKGIYEKYFKRPLDVFFSTGALIVFSPILLVTAILVRIKLGSPVLFTQQRPGLNDKIFKLYKFRTMTDQRDDSGNLLSDEIRLTNFGKKLRSTSLDELPELFNIIKGDMSIVGPRPLAVIYLPYYTKRERHRHDVRPGLTGWAQVNGRNSISWEEKFKYDVEYINMISFFNDAKIIFLTLRKVFLREGIGQGAQHPGSLHEIRADWLDDHGRIKPEYDNIHEE